MEKVGSASIQKGATVSQTTVISEYILSYCEAPMTTSDYYVVMFLQSAVVQVYPQPVSLHKLTYYNADSVSYIMGWFNGNDILLELWYLWGWRASYPWGLDKTLLILFFVIFCTCCRSFITHLVSSWVLVWPQMMPSIHHWQLEELWLSWLLCPFPLWTELDVVSCIWVVWLGCSCSALSSPFATTLLSKSALTHSCAANYQLFLLV